MYPRNKRKPYYIDLLVKIRNRSLNQLNFYREKVDTETLEKMGLYFATIDEPSEKDTVSRLKEKIEKALEAEASINRLATEFYERG